MNDVELKLTRSTQELPECNIPFESLTSYHKEHKTTCFFTHKIAIVYLIVFCIIFTGFGVYASNVEIEKGMWLTHTSYFYAPIKLRSKFYDLDVKLKINQFSLQEANYYGVVDHGKSKLNATIHPDYKLMSLTYKDGENVVDIFIGKTDNEYWKTFFHYDAKNDSIGILNNNYKKFKYKDKVIYMNRSDEAYYDTAYYLDSDRKICFEITSNQNNMDDIVKIFIDNL